MLTVHSPISWDLIYVVETPDSYNLEVGSGHIRENLLNVLVRCQEATPVAICPGIVLRLSVDVEEQAVRLGE